MLDLELECVGVPAAMGPVRPLGGGDPRSLALLVELAVGARRERLARWSPLLPSPRLLASSPHCPEWSVSRLRAAGEEAWPARGEVAAQTRSPRLQLPRLPLEAWGGAGLRWPRPRPRPRGNVSCVGAAAGIAEQGRRVEWQWRRVRLS